VGPPGLCAHGNVLSRGSPILRVRNGAAQDGSLRAAEGPGLLVYNITNNQITGAALLGTVGLDRQLGGFAADPPTDDASVGQLVQAIAGFDGGSGPADSLNAAPLSTDTSQQSLLTIPQHA
jgi:hypothetical protein